MPMARHFGTLTAWHESQGFGEVTPAAGSHAPLTVTRHALAAAGILDPGAALGAAVTFSFGDISSDGPGGAVRIERAGG